jgi:hypothetical protein
MFANVHEEWTHDISNCNADCHEDSLDGQPVRLVDVAFGAPRGPIGRFLSTVQRRPTIRCDVHGFLASEQRLAGVKSA